MKHTYIGLDRILSLLGGAKKKRGDEYICICPCHDDKDPSLWVKETEKGIVMIDRARRCQTSDICAAIGIQTSELFRDPPTGGRERKNRADKKPAAPSAQKEKKPDTVYSDYVSAYRKVGQVVKVYPYTDASGLLRFEAVRIRKPDGEKTFRLHRPVDPAKGSIPFVKSVPKEILGGRMFASYMGLENSFMPSNIEVSGGTMTEEELRRGPYLEVVDFSDFQVDEMTGDIFGEIRLAYWHDGEKTVPVSGGSLSGSMHDFIRDMRLTEEKTQYDQMCIPALTLLKDGTVTGAGE